MFKRVSSIVLTVVMLISMLCTITVANAASELPGLVLGTESVVVKHGDVVTVDLAIRNPVKINAITVKMPYDTEIFSDYAVYCMTTGGVFESNRVGDDIIISVVSEQNLIPDWPYIARVEFTVSDSVHSGEYEIGPATIQEMCWAEYDGDNKLIANHDYVVGEEYNATSDCATLTVDCTSFYEYTKPQEGTAKEDAEHTITCSKCGYSDVGDCRFGNEIVVTPDTCNGVGTSKIECEFCKYAVEFDVDDIKEHKWSTAWYVDGTTPADASQHYQICENDHCEARTYADCSSWNWNNVATETGSKHICADCGRQMACRWQKYATRIGETCTDDAYTAYPCTVSGCTGSYTVVEVGTATGHAIVKDPSGTTHSCSKCGDLKNVACTFSKTVQTGDSCTKDTIKECECGNRQTIEAPGYHPEAKKVIQYKAPSENSSGYIQLTCTSCNAKLAYELNKTLAKGKQFNDIATDNWFYDTSIFAKSFNLMGGDAEGNFNGNGDLTRGMVVTVLGRYCWGYLEQMTEQEFDALLDSLGGEPVELKDLKGDYYDRYAIALSTIGVVKGAYGNFSGDDNVTREQLAAFFIRYINYIAPDSDVTYGSSSTLSDMSTVSDWAKAEAAKAVELGLIAGMEGKFNPLGTATRAQMATIMERIVRAHSVYPIVDVK